MSINNVKQSNTVNVVENANNGLVDGHLNHMNGISYDISNPITQLRIVSSSCYFGEPKYYVDRSEGTYKIETSVQKLNSHCDSLLKSVITVKLEEEQSPAAFLESVIDAALDYDIEKTLQEAVRLRNEEHMRTTPQVIMVRAAHHPKCRGTGLIAKYGLDILKRTDEASVQLAYHHQAFGKKAAKKSIPNALKKVWKKFLEARNEYDLAKYRMSKREYKTTDVVSLCHAFSPEIDKLMKDDLKLSVEDTWEALISKEGSNKENWTKAIDLMGHTALLRNLRNMITHKVENNLFIDKLLKTSPYSKELPFAYYNAYLNIKDTASPSVLDSLENCLNISLGKMPKFNGKVMCLSDNSGSAHGAFKSENSNTTVATIGNLTSILTAKLADEGYIGIFGNELKILPVRKNTSVFDDLNTVEKAAKNIGANTENGIWLFFDNAIKNKEHWDHIFVYSDQQAGHGGLYGLNHHQYSQYVINGNYIDVAKLVKVYREKVNPNVNVYLVQTAGYKDTIVPEFYERTFILGGWSSGVIKFAHKVSQEFDKSQNFSVKKIEQKEEPVQINIQEEKSSEVKKLRIRKV